MLVFMLVMVLMLTVLIRKYLTLYLILKMIMLEHNVFMALEIILVKCYIGLFQIIQQLPFLIKYLFIIILQKLGLLMMIQLLVLVIFNQVIASCGILQQFIGLLM